MLYITQILCTFMLFEESERQTVREKVFKDRNWASRFMKRYNFSFRRRTMKTANRFDPDNREHQILVIEHLEKMKQLMSIYNDDQIINMDETAIPYEPIPGLIIAEKGAKDVNPKDSVNPKQSCTGVVTVTKSGKLLKPMVILPQLKSNPFTLENCYVTHSHSGKMNDELMIEWFDNIIVPYLNENGFENCLIILDQYGSHKTEFVKDYIKDLSTLHLLPSSTTGFLQPLDVNFFGVLKRNMTNKWALQRFEETNGEMSVEEKLAVRRRAAVDLFINEVNAIDKQTIIKSFHMCGILNQNKITSTGLTETLIEIITNFQQEIVY